MLTKIFILVLIGAFGISVSDEEWKWDTAEKSDDVVGRTPQRHQSSRLVFEDPAARNPRVYLGSRHEQTRPNTGARVHSVQTVDTPRESSRTHLQSSSGEVVNVPISVNIAKTGPNDRASVTVAPGGSEGRFTKHIEKTFCKMGIGYDCHTKIHGKYRHRGQYIDIDTLPYLPQPVHPPQFHHPQPIHSHHSVPYGGGIQASDVFHVQPVALQAVGGPIQAVPLGHSGGQIPHTQAVPQVPSYTPTLHQSVINPYDNLAAIHGNIQKPQQTYTAPANVKVVEDKDGTIVQHIHKHTHIYHGDSNSREYGSAHRPPRRHHSLPSIPPHPNSLYGTSGYRESCECVPAWQCSKFDIVGRSNGLIDARNKKGPQIYSNNTANEETTTEKSNSRRKRAAKTVKRQTNTYAQGRRLSVGYTPSRDGCARGDVCCRDPARHDQSGPRVGSCGRRHSSGVVGRVKTPYHEAGDTDFGEYPWQAAILKQDGGDMVYVCGGSLIDDRYIITAAHCVNKLSAFDLQVRLGEWDVAMEDEFYPHVDYKVDEVVVHRDFYAGMLHHDIALLKLDRFVDSQRYPHISPICLPEAYSNFEGQTCHVTGWGKDAFGKIGNFQKILKKVEVPMVGKRTCEHALKDTRLGRSFRLHDGMICAGGEEGKDACKGDGGGPLVCREGGRYQLAGVVSWGIGCGERGVPGVYVDVAYYSDWIIENTRH